jgi:hypothetical protein
MFRGNVDVKIETLTGYDMFGNPDTLSSKLQTVKGAVIGEKSSIGQTISTSGASSNTLNASTSELNISLIILVPPSTISTIGDKLTVRGKLFMIAMKDEKYDVYGIHNHTHLECVTWQ